MKVGVIGLGSIGLRHAKNLLELGHEVWGYDPDHKRRELLPQATMASHEKVLTQTDAVVIASPSERHFDDMMVAAKLGKPVLVEKPLWVRMPNSYSIDFIKKCPIYVGNMLRFHPCVQKAKEWMSEIGEPYRASFTLSQKTEKDTYLTDGVVLNWLSHEVDLALYLLGRTLHGAAMVRVVKGVDLLADVILMHSNGCQSTVHGDFIGRPLQERMFTIHGSETYMEINIAGCAYFLAPFKSGTLRPLNSEKIWDSVYKDEIKAFMDVAQGKSDARLATGRDGLHTLEILCDIRKAAGLK